MQPLGSCYDQSVQSSNIPNTHNELHKAAFDDFLFCQSLCDKYLAF
jgi:hypothetical protein